MDMIILIEQVKMCPRVLTRTNECVCGHSIFTRVAFLYMFTVDALCTCHSVSVYFFYCGKGNWLALFFILRFMRLRRPVYSSQ